MKKLGLVALGLGVLILLASFGSDTAPDGTHNIGLLQQQLMLFQLGGILMLLGGAFAAAGTVLQRFEAAGVLPPAGYTAPAAARDTGPQS